MDYVPCDGTEAVMCSIEGIMLTVSAPLCLAHQKAFYKMGADVRPDKEIRSSMVHRRSP